MAEKDVPLFPIKVKNTEIKLPEIRLYAIATPRVVCGRSFLQNKIWLINFKALKFCYCSE
ncbi:MAG: hypothetical protein ACFFD2_03610 [Promethearchaeota archaeon]